MNEASVYERLPEDRSLPEMPCNVGQHARLLRADHSSASSETLPEHRLMIALVRDAIRCIEKYRHARDFRGRRLFDEDSRWLLSDNTSWIYAFLRVCETLDLDPTAVRIALGFEPAGDAFTREPVRTAFLLQ